ncbi:unnamed protein product [Pararhodospirillum photometricum DSM 122]|uniref:Uncharacterized protein n=1 Tax=Pararhodospirillum photometricum DSM 122 TaxID=1150469 RepID=H6SNE1_PARPM|nr:unnamed protein product [Pararhodospirillum photometricum DSM 122]
MEFVQKLRTEFITPLSDINVMSTFALKAGFSRVEQTDFDPTLDPNGPSVGVFSVFYNIYK